MQNPLLEKSTAPFGATPFDRIRTEHFLPAIEVAIAAAREKIRAIRTDSRPANFDNTIAALEAATAQFYDIGTVYSSLKHAHGDAALHALAREIMPKAVEFESDINLDAVLFARVVQVYQGRASGLTPEQRTLTEKVWRSFRRNGAQLGEADKARLRRIDEELSTLGPQFSENVLKCTNDFQLVITDPQDLQGIPESIRQGYQEVARSRGLAEGSWLVTLHAPSFIPFMKYAESRALRERLHRAYASRCAGGPWDNSGLVRQISALRLERALLLGYPSHAHFQTEERMAESPDNVRRFLERLLVKSRPAAEREIRELEDYMRRNGADYPLQSWDYSYWSNRLREERFQVSSEELRPYFQLERVRDGAFATAGRLFGLTFRRRDGVPLYAPEVEVFEVHDGQEFLGLLYTDFHPRDTKGGGAWCTRYRPQWQDDQGDHRPHVGIVCNFSRPVGGKPALLTFQEVTTLFHEFGHALHGLLSKVRHRSLCCTNVYRDFVELPSQILENWVRDPKGLELFASHFETGTPVPAALIGRLIESERFHAGVLMIRQLRFAFLDLAWCGEKLPAEANVEKFEVESLRETQLMPHIPGTNNSTSFEHVFSGGYSAGYYGYKWAEVLDADAFEFFREKGIFSPEVARKFRTAVLERGGSAHPMELYREFRGRAPDEDALLRRSGLI